MDEISYHISVYQSIEEKVEMTEEYVCHFCDDKDESKLLFGEVYSYEFQHILMLLGIEFEAVAKLICKHIDAAFVPRTIVDYTKIILDNYTEIKSVEINSKHMRIVPFRDWHIELGEGSERVVGLDWWRAYNNIKHNGYSGFKAATLSNVIYGLASLYVLELYYIQGETHKTFSKKSSYFSSDYERGGLAFSGPLLPDIKKELQSQE